MSVIYSRRIRESAGPLAAINVCAAGILMLLAAFLWQMQVLKGGEYRRMAAQNRVRLIRLPAPRGSIYDRSGNVLADNRLGFDIEVIPEDMDDREIMEGALGEILGLPPQAIRERIARGRTSTTVAVTVASDVDLPTVIAVEERQPSLAGVRVAAYPRRRYPKSCFAAHALGHVGAISGEELGGLRSVGYTMHDILGKSGVEKSCEKFLAGKAGDEGVQVDSRGYPDRLLYRRDPVPGMDLRLTLDSKTQEAAESVLRGEKGAVIAIDPRNGEVLAMASSPGYDPNDFVPPPRQEAVRALLSDEEHPLVNRAIQGLYQPGSLFKVVVATAALEKGSVNRNTSFNCDGLFRLGRRIYHCWYERGHGRVTIEDALMFSCNVFFYNTGLRAGRDAIMETASMFGVDKKTGVDIPGEKAGVVPTDAWRAGNGVSSWSPGDTVVHAIGQGYLLVSPIRMAVLYAAIANGGTLYMPYVVSEIVSPLGDVVERRAPKIAGRISIKEETLDLVRGGLKKAVNSRLGTGQKAKLGDLEVAGKTGTVQVGPPEKRRNHAWFVGYAPFDDPRIVLAVMLEGRRSGGFFAAPAAKKIFAAHFHPDGAGDVPLEGTRE